MAMLMTLFQTLTLHGVDDRGYLRAYLEACAQNRSQAPEDLPPLAALELQSGHPRCARAHSPCALRVWLDQWSRAAQTHECREALLRMERAGLVRLPPSQTPNGNGRRSSLNQRLPWPLSNAPATCICPHPWRCRTASSPRARR